MFKIKGKVKGFSILRKTMQCKDQQALCFELSQIRNPATGCADDSFRS